MVHKDPTTPDNNEIQGGKRVFDAKGIGANVFLTAAAAIVPLVIVGAASVASLADRRKARGRLRLPRR